MRQCHLALRRGGEGVWAKGGADMRSKGFVHVDAPRTGLRHIHGLLEASGRCGARGRLFSCTSSVRRRRPSSRARAAMVSMRRLPMPRREGGEAKEANRQPDCVVSASPPCTAWTSIMRGGKVGVLRVFSAKHESTAMMALHLAKITSFSLKHRFADRACKGDGRFVGVLASNNSTPIHP